MLGMPLIQLIRHAESVANSGGVSLTPGCIPLSELGITQAAALPAQFASAPDLIVLSSYIRTHLTAAPLLAKFPGIPVETWPVQEFTYLHPGKYANTTVVQRTPEAREYWRQADPYHRAGPGAESFADFIGRADETLRRISTRRESHICIFTHSYFINALHWRCANPAHEITPGSMAQFLEFRRNNPVENAKVNSFALLPVDCLKAAQQLI